jgi:hypothetical protein
MRGLSLMLLAVSFVACTSPNAGHRPPPLDLSGTWIVDASTGTSCYALRIQGGDEASADALVYWAPANSGCSHRSSSMVAIAAEVRHTSTGQQTVSAAIGLMEGGFTNVSVTVTDQSEDTAGAIVIKDGRSSLATLRRVDRLMVPLGLPSR